MNIILRYLVGLFAIPILFASCSGDKLRPIQEEEGGKPGIVRFTLSNSLRAIGDENQTRPTPALEREKKINKLFAVVFKKSSGLHHKTVECTSPTNDATFEFDNEKSGEFYFFLIANPDSDLEKELKKGSSTLEDLGGLIATQSPGEDNSANNFLMTSDQVNVNVNSKTSTTLTETINLVRVAARFDFYNKIEDLKITKIKFGKRYTSTHLYPQVGSMDGLTFTEETKEYDGNLFENGVLKASVYGYETDTRNETYFTLEGTYKGHPIKPETIRLENFVIKRNHLYNIILHELGGGVNPNDPNNQFGKLKYEIKVADWEEGEGLTMDEEMVLKPLFVGYDAEIANASYLTPYLKDSQKEIFTTTKQATKITIKVHTFIREGSLELGKDYNQTGVTLNEVGTVKDHITGRITKTYELTLPEQSDYLATITFTSENEAKKPQFFEVPLVAKNFSGETIKEFTVKHGRIKMPLEHLSETPLNTQGNGFASVGNKVSEVGYFLHRDKAVKEFKKCTIQGKAYHMPSSIYEVASILPQKTNNKSPIGCSKEIVDNYHNIGFWVLLPALHGAAPGGKNIFTRVKVDTYNDFSKQVSYALMFKDESQVGYGRLLLMAYKYEWMGDFKPVPKEKEGDEITSYLKITSRYLGANWDGRVEDIANDEFWLQNTSNDATRSIYALGDIDYNDKRDDNSGLEDLGSVAMLVTPDTQDADPGDGLYAHVGYIHKERAIPNFMRFANRLPYYGSVGFPIWLFSDK